MVCTHMRTLQRRTWQATQASSRSCSASSVAAQALAVPASGPISGDARMLAALTHWSSSRVCNTVRVRSLHARASYWRSAHAQL